MNFKPMTKQDLYGFAGCEDFASGSLPEIAEIKIGYVDYLAIADGTGITIMNDDIDNIYFLPFKTEGGTRRTMARLPDTIQSLSTLQTTHGFKKVS